MATVRDYLEQQLQVMACTWSENKLRPFIVWEKGLVRNGVIFSWMIPPGFCLLKSIIVSANISLTHRHEIAKICLKHVAPLVYETRWRCISINIISISQCLVKLFLKYMSVMFCGATFWGYSLRQILIKPSMDTSVIYQQDDRVV